MIKLSTVLELPLARRRSELAPYYIQLRHAERQILVSALLATEWDFELAADSLGIGHRYLRARATQLGGVLPNTTSNEPPPAILAKKVKESP